jgi:DNA-binding NtrC family response regulator
MTQSHSPNFLTQNPDYQGDPAHPLIGSSQSMRLVRKEALVAAQMALPVLITGETGTGKEVVAHYLHAVGPRAAENFLAVNCVGIPDTLLQSELFGVVKGAYTDARESRPGVFEQAGRGVILLDEITEMSWGAQANLLRVLETSVVRRLGSTKDQDVYAKVVAATNKNLFEYVSQGRFRQDLFYRLDGFRIQLPPLREHPEDIGPLVEHFLNLSKQRYGNGTVAREFIFEPGVFETFSAYPWPGNVRQLRGLMDNIAAHVAYDSGFPTSVTREMVVPLLKRDEPSSKLTVFSPEEQKLAAEFVELLRTRNWREGRVLLDGFFASHCLRESNGHMSHAATELGVDRTTFRKMLERYRRITEE